ncbi:histamine N-methyltransferase A-like [Lycodopsis pacificus]
MAVDPKTTCYDDTRAQSFQSYLQQSGQHKAVLRSLHKVLPGEFKRIGVDQSSLDVLSVGSGGGEVDVEILTLLQSTFPAVPITTDIVEGSTQLTDNFKALVTKTPNLQKIPFAWHLMSSENYETQVKVKGDMKKFDFIQMVQMLYYVDNLTDTITFYHSLLKNNGRLMIIIGAANCSYDILWKTYKKELGVGIVRESRSSAEVIACLKSLGLKYEEHDQPNSFDITECFNPSNQTGKNLLNFMTAKNNFYESFTPELRAGILNHIRNKCSTEKDGRVMFNNNMSCILVHA